MGVIALMPLQASGACPVDPVGQAQRAAAGAEGAFASMDDTAFAASIRDLEASLRCIDAPVPAEVAVQVHRAKALAAHILDQDDDRCRRCWAAVRALTPEWRPSETLMPPGLPLTVLFEEADADQGGVPLAQVPPGGWEVDGHPSTTLPLGRAFLLVGFDEHGRVVDSGYFHRVTDVQPFVDPAAARRTASVRRWGTVAAGGLAVASGVAFASSAHARGQLKDPSTAAGDLVPYQVAANSRLGAAVGLGTLSVASVVAVWSVRW